MIKACSAQEYALQQPTKHTVSGRTWCQTHWGGSLT